MATNLYDDALDFLPEAKAAKPAKSGRGILGALKMLIGAFTDARTAAARYDTLIGRGVPSGRAARMAFDTVYEQN